MRHPLAGGECPENGHGKGRGVRLTVKIRNATDGRTDLQVLELSDLEVCVRGVREIPETVRDAAARLTGRPADQFIRQRESMGSFHWTEPQERLRTLYIRTPGPVRRLSSPDSAPNARGRLSSWRAARRGDCCGRDADEEGLRQPPVGWLVSLVLPSQPPAR